MQQAAHEAFIVRSRLYRRNATPAAQCRAGVDLDLPPYPVAAGRLQLPTLADLLGLCRRGDRALWAVGRRMDDPGAIAALPAMGHFGDRQRAPHETAGRAMVSAVAIRPMARRQRSLNSWCAPPSTEMRACRERQRHRRIDLIPRWGGQEQCAGKSATVVTIPDISTCWRLLRWSL